MLFSKECRRILTSLTFIIYCFVVGLFFVSQYFEECNGVPYVPDEKISEDHDVIMHGAVDDLATEFFANNYVCYPYGFYKSVRLKEDDSKKVEECLLEVTGLTHDELMDIRDSGEKYYIERGVQETMYYEIGEMPVSDTITYERFCELMGKVDDILGGGSNYKVDDIVFRYSYVPMTDEEIEGVISDLYDKDGVAGGYARLFSDYMGIVLGIMPVFVTAALVSADRRKRVSDLIYTRKISSFKLVFSRYTALVVMMFIPVIFCMIAASIQLIKNFDFSDLALYRMFTLPTFWLLPQIMIVTAVAMIVTEVFSSGIAILLQFAWWFHSNMSNGERLSGSIGKFDLICRHNTIYGRDEFLLSRNDFIFNRVFFFIAAIVITALTAYIFELKRGGRFNGFRLFGKDSIFRHKA
ncbi:ABC transporter permease [Ruminococcus sp.]|uniref:ABC transporter permease n=1 Tax=Ruminococcus sp. TaxID=41978 RepID=UPI002C6E6603|nr:ABC transporter permease [Ruminococcus sp.]HOA00138.1 ABC transporter permease [Ruminococcus sp.]HOH87502.1 ABC transporter permease [Ruminococcus sp.]